MQVSVETLKGLERKLTISVPTEKIEEEVSLRLKNLARTVKIHGFRPGNVPLKVVAGRYAQGLRQEVVQDMIQSTLHEALQENHLVLAGSPFVEPETLEKGKDFKYTAVFEIMPEFEVNELNQASVDLIQSKVNDEDVDDIIYKLREQNKKWNQIDQKVEKGHKVVIDFEGFIDEKTFKGGTSSNYELIIGSGAMIPGFEEGIIDKKQGDSFDVHVTFPDKYTQADLSGKEAVFKITLQKVMEGSLPELDDDFAKLFNITEGGIEALTRDIKENMCRELERKVSKINKERLFDKLMEVNKFDLPVALIDKEIEHLKHEAFHRIYGNEHKENEVIPDFPKKLFEHQAIRRVHLGLLFIEYIKKHQLSVDKEKVNIMIDKLCSAYENPDQLRAWYQNSKEQMVEVEALVMEDMVVEKIALGASINYTDMDYASVMNPKQGSEEKGE